MHFDKVTLDLLLGEITELPADWMDDTAMALVAQVKESVGELRALGRPVAVDDLANALEQDPTFLDVCRLFLGKGQESVAHMLGEHLDQKMTWTAFRAFAAREPARVASALAALDLPAVIDAHLERRWEAEDVLIERYKMSRGRAIAGQRRGRALEDEVESVLIAASIPFDSRTTFTGKKGQTAKSDFAIPTKESPKIVIEAKGFEATGSKLTDFLGDILKIGRAKDFHMYFFLVTDGRGWHNRVSDLKKIVEYHDEGLIDMIYTRRRLADLAAAVKRIIETE